MTSDCTELPAWLHPPCRRTLGLPKRAKWGAWPGGWTTRPSCGVCALSARVRPPVTSKGNPSPKTGIQGLFSLLIVHHIIRPSSTPYPAFRSFSRYLQARFCPFLSDDQLLSLLLIKYSLGSDLTTRGVDFVSTLGNRSQGRPGIDCASSSLLFPWDDHHFAADARRCPFAESLHIAPPFQSW